MRLLKLCLCLGFFFCFYTHVATANDLQQRLLDIQNQAKPAPLSTQEDASQPTLDDIEALMKVNRYAEARRQMALMDMPKPQNGRGLYQYFDGLAAVHLGDMEAAQKRFKRWRGKSPLRAYLGLNIGVALSDADKLQEAEQWLSKTAKLKLPPGEEWLALLDRVHLYRGGIFNFLAQPNQARNALKKVRLEGVDAHRALLSLGWTDIALSQPRNALAPWTYLAEQDKSDAMVQEALLLVPFAYTRLNAYGKASNSLSQAIRIYDIEMARLQKARKPARQGQFLAAMERKHAASNASLPQLVQAVFGQSLSQYFTRFMQDSRFSALIEGYYETLKLPQSSAVVRLKRDYAVQINQHLEQYFVAEIKRLSGYKKHASFSLAESYQRLANQAEGY